MLQIENDVIVEFHACCKESVMFVASFYASMLYVWNPPGPTPNVIPGPLAQRSRTESWAQWSLRRGLESLPQAITDFLAQSGRVELHRYATVKQLCLSASGWEVSNTHYSVFGLFVFYTTLRIWTWLQDLAEQWFGILAVFTTEPSLATVKVQISAVLNMWDVLVFVKSCCDLAVCLCVFMFVWLCL